MSDENNLYCQHCFEEISEDEKFVCPACGIFYHSKCWISNYGCAVISCSQKNILLNPLYQSSVPVRELLVHIEYLLNVRKYREVIEECQRIINIEKNNIEAKKFYNEAISLINTKTRLFENAEELFKKKEYKAAILFYKDCLKLSEGKERDYIIAKLRYLTELIPAYKRKKHFANAVYAFIILLLISSLTYLVYYNLYLKEDREFADIAMKDDFTVIKNIENQIANYERFLNKYPEGKYKENAKEKIKNLCFIISEKIYEDDWRTALIYLKKINKKENPKTYSDMFKLIAQSASNELKEYVESAKKYNSSNNYLDARNSVEKGISLIENIPDFEFVYSKQKLLNDKNLLNKKIGYITKVKDLENEINEKLTYLKKIEPEVSYENIIQISGKVMRKNGNELIIKSQVDKKLYFVKTDGSKYEKGEDVFIECVKTGKTEISDDAGNQMVLPSFKEIASSQSLFGNSDKDLLFQRLKYLRDQKSRVDSVLRIPL